jgi:hypothetical protein
MFHHERIEAVIGLKIYFADPHSPRQHGSNKTQMVLRANTCRKAPSSASGTTINSTRSPTNSTSALSYA